MTNEIHILRRTPDDASFIQMVAELDAYLADYNGPDHEFYAGFNNLDSLQGAVVAMIEDQPVGCGAFRRREAESGEVKRMYVHPAHRGNGIARQVLQEIEAWAREQGIATLQLETGVFMQDARLLYESNGYQYIPNYPPYVGLEASVCMEKRL